MPTAPLQRIYDPLSGDLATGTGPNVQFPNNAIPAGRMNRDHRSSCSALYPPPNVEGTGAGGLHERTTGLTQAYANTDRHNYDAERSTGTGRRAHQLWGKYSHMNARGRRPVQRSPWAAPIGDGGDTKVQLITGGQTWSFGRSLLHGQLDRCLDHGSVLQLARLRSGHARSGLWHSGHERPGARRSALCGHARIQDRISARSATRRRGVPPIATRGRSVSFSTNVTKVAGRNHEFRVGYRRRLPARSTTGSRNGPTRAGGSTSPATPRSTFGTGSQTGNFYNQYAAFLLGLVGTARKSYQYELFTGREWQHAHVRARPLDRRARSSRSISACGGSTTRS